MFETYVPYATIIIANIDPSVSPAYSIHEYCMMNLHDNLHNLELNPSWPLL